MVLIYFIFLYHIYLQKNVKKILFSGILPVTCLENHFPIEKVKILFISNVVSLPFSIFINGREITFLTPPRCPVSTLQHMRMESVHHSSFHHTSNRIGEFWEFCPAGSCQVYTADIDLRPHSRRNSSDSHQTERRQGQDQTSSELARSSSGVPSSWILSVSSTPARPRRPSGPSGSSGRDTSSRWSDISVSSTCSKWW